MTGDLHREHWRVRVSGPTPADPEGSAHAIAHSGGTVSLHPNCGTFQAAQRLHVGQAAQLSTGIWDAATYRISRASPDLAHPIPAQSTRRSLRETLGDASLDHPGRRQRRPAHDRAAAA